MFRFYRHFFAGWQINSFVLIKYAVFEHLTSAQKPEKKNVFSSERYDIEASSVDAPAN